MRPNNNYILLGFDGYLHFEIVQIQRFTRFNLKVHKLVQTIVNKFCTFRKNEQTKYTDLMGLLVIY